MTAREGLATVLVVVVGLAVIAAVLGIMVLTAPVP